MMAWYSVKFCNNFALCSCVPCVLIEKLHNYSAGVLRFSAALSHTLQVLCLQIGTSTVDSSALQNIPRISAYFFPHACTCYRTVRLVS